MQGMNKEQIRKRIIEGLEEDYSLYFGAAKKAHDAAVNEENIPDNKYDTLSLEASYLAQGQANRAQEIKAALEAYRKLEMIPFGEHSPLYLTALVTLEGGDGSLKRVFIGPLAGGLKVELDGEDLVVITPESPLGRALLGRTLGDEVSLIINNARREYEIVDLC